MCVVIRWVDEVYDIYEDAIGLMQVPKTDADTLKMYWFVAFYH